MEKCIPRQASFSTGQVTTICDVIARKGLRHHRLLHAFECRTKILSAANVFRKMARSAQCLVAAKVHRKSTERGETCASCQKTKRERSDRKRVTVLSGARRAQHRNATCPDSGRRNLTHELALAGIRHGHVTVVLPLYALSLSPLIVYISGNQLLIDVDKSRRYCASCNRKRRVCVPCPLGFVDLPAYAEVRKLRFTYISDGDVMVIDGAVKGLLPRRRGHVARLKSLARRIMQQNLAVSR